MNINKNKRWKRILGIVLAGVITVGSLVGIGFGAYNISNSTNISSDFSDGRSIQLNLRLFKTDNNKVLVNTTDPNNPQPIPLYDKKTEEDNVKKSAKALTNILKNKGLTNIEVSYGYSYTNNNQKVMKDGQLQSLFKDDLEPIAVLYANFENAESAFGLKDVDDEINSLFNDKQVYDTLNDSFAYEVEIVKQSYSGPNYKISNATKQDTGRSNKTSILYNKAGQAQDGNKLESFGFYDTDLMKNNKINVFVDRDGKESSSAIAYTLKDSKNNLDWSYFNSYQFGEQNKQYQEIKKKEEGSSGSTPQGINDINTSNDPNSNGSNSGGSDSETALPTESQQYQTTYTWFLWKDKQGLIDYLNSLIGVWYYNLYANRIPNGIDWVNADKTTILEKLFPTSDNPSNVVNATSSQVRKQINTVIDNLSEVEKSFIASAIFQTAGNLTDVSTWRPPLITENDLIPVLYNFLNSKTFSPVTPVDPSNLANDNADGVSQSVKNGWSFLESTNSDLQSFIGQYYAGTIDYRNFNTYFEDPNKPKEPTEEEPNPIPEPFSTNQFKIDSAVASYGLSAQALADTLNDESYKFPFLVSNISTIVDNWQTIQTEFQKLNGERYEAYKNGQITLEQYNEEKTKFANHYFNGNNLYSEQYITPASIATSFISSSFNPLNILLIILGSIIFIVGIFVSVRYRIPGLFAFIASGLVFVLSALLYNLFGYVFSFYSLLALAIGTFLSFIVPSFLFRNIEKEIAEGSSLSAAILKSTKKYWKMSLDTHVMSILASLAFLFFGQTGNINFGAMLIISVFLSFILSGIIYFILLLLYVYFIQFDKNTWFVSNKFFTKLTSASSFKKLYFYNKLNFFNKPSYIVVGIFVLIGLIGSIFVSINGPIISLDFSASSVLIINNFNAYGLSQDQVINALSITASHAYVYDNQLVIYTLNNLNLDNTLNVLRTLVKPELLNSLANDTIISTLTSEYAISVVENTVKCMAIAIGFCSIWSLLSLNIVSIIPFALIQLMSMIITVGTISLVAIPIDLNTIASFIFIFIITTALSASLISSIKSSWDRKLLISKENLKQLINSIVAKINPNYVWLVVCISVFALFSLALSSTSLIFSFVIIIIGALYWIFINNNVLILSWFGFVLIRNMFNKELLKSKNEKLHHVHDYDNVNEQKIVGINC